MGRNEWDQLKIDEVGGQAKLGTVSSPWVNEHPASIWLWLSVSVLILPVHEHHTHTHTLLHAWCLLQSSKLLGAAEECPLL